MFITYQVQSFPTYIVRIMSLRRLKKKKLLILKLGELRYQEVGGVSQENLCTRLAIWAATVYQQLLNTPYGRNTKRIACKTVDMTFMFLDGLMAWALSSNSN